MIDSDDPDFLDPRDAYLDFPRGGGEPSSFDMLDVLVDARKQAVATQKAAMDQMAHHALVLLVSGVDPRAVAAKCGFGRARRPSDRRGTRSGGRVFYEDEDYTITTQRMTHPLGGMVEMRAETPSDIGFDAFRAWIMSYLQEVINGDRPLRPRSE